MKGRFGLQWLYMHHAGQVMQMLKTDSSGNMHAQGSNGCEGWEKCIRIWLYLISKYLL